MGEAVSDQKVTQEQLGVPKIPAPARPVAGAAVAAPLTGQGRSGHDVSTASPAAPGPSRPQSPVIPPRRVRSPTPSSENAARSVPAASASAPVPASHPYAAVPDPALASLLQQALNMRQPTPQQFLLFVVPEDAFPRVETFPDVQKQIARLRELRGSPCHAFPAMGHLFQLTGGDYPFLRTPMGDFPLFEIVSPQEADVLSHGWLGPSMDQPQAPISERPPVSADDDAEESEEEPELTETPATVDEDHTPVFDV